MRDSFSRKLKGLQRVSRASGDLATKASIEHREEHWIFVPVKVQVYDKSQVKENSLPIYQTPESFGYVRNDFGVPWKRG